MSLSHLAIHVILAYTETALCAIFHSESGRACHRTSNWGGLQKWFPLGFLLETGLRWVYVSGGTLEKAGS